MSPCLHIIAHMDMAPCLYIGYGYDSMDLDMGPFSTYYHSHGYGYGTMDLDIITYMDLDMVPCPHITA